MVVKVDHSFALLSNTSLSMVRVLPAATDTFVTLFIEAPIVSVIVVDDGSKDLTDIRAKESGAIVVRHRFNQGYDAALQSGFQKAEFSLDWLDRISLERGLQWWTL